MLVTEITAKSIDEALRKQLDALNVNIESREYNGRWYTDIRAWRIQPKQTEAPAPMPDMPPIVEEPAYASAPAASTEVDDLPF